MVAYEGFFLEARCVRRQLPLESSTNQARVDPLDELATRDYRSFRGFRESPAPEACSLARYEATQATLRKRTNLPTYLAKVQIDFYGTTSVATLGVPAQQRPVARATLKYDVIPLLPLCNCTVLLLAEFSPSHQNR